MLTRLYVDNFRCLVNFELKLDKLNLLMGRNGSGKSTVFDILFLLREFIGGKANVAQVFPSRELTRWDMRRIQKFELDLSVDEKEYNYVLEIEHDEFRSKARIQVESLYESGQPLYEAREGTAQLYRDNHSRGPEYPSDWSRSGIASIPERNDNKKLVRFREEISRFVIAALSPHLMERSSREEAAVIDSQMGNFVSWYRHVTQAYQGGITPLFDALKQVIPGFHSTTLRDAGEGVKTLKILIDVEKETGNQFDFHELSDGQRVLIALYSLLHLSDKNLSLFIDEPDNYVALREIQPWLMALEDSVRVEQAVLISHHPEVIDFVGESKGRWFSRDGNTPTRVSEEIKNSVKALRLSEVIARGWEE